MHVNEEALILHYYGEGNDASVEAHLASCPTCRTEFEKLRRVLALLDEQPVPEPPPAFERQMWARIQPQLEATHRGWLDRLLHFQGTPKWALAGGLAALVLAAFVAGRFTSPTVPTTPATDPAVAADLGERLLLVAVVDHLDRSQMVLVELLNGSDTNDLATISAEQDRARELVAANRLYRQSAVQAGDNAIGETLEDLERVLLEIANAPENVTSEDVAALREQIGARGLLFRVRVVQSEIRERERVNQQQRVSG